jgi:hypothetical protein
MNEPQQKKSTTRESFLKNSIVNIIVSIVSKLLTIPLFIWTYRIIPNLNWPYFLDKILIYVIIFILLHIVLKYFKGVVLPLFILSIAFLTFGSIKNQYGFHQLYKDYEAMIYAIIYDPVPAKLNLKPYTPFPNERPLRKAMNYNSPVVRDFAHYAINKHFKDIQQNNPQRLVIQCFAVFKEINTRWNYINDPKSRDYYAKASESTKFLSGDCDDHSTLMAACIKAIGGTPRLILTTHHLYPEMYVGDEHDMEHINVLIRKVMFVEESKNKRLNYHVDQDGKVWINLDYTAKYPGGEFMAEKVLGILVL